MPMENHACYNNKCSHMCLLGPNRSYTCACPENMELVNGMKCQQSKKMENIILGVGKHIVAIPHQTFGRHVTSDAQEIGSLVDLLEFNSLSGQVFVAESKLAKIVTVDMKSQIESVLVDQHLLSVKAMAFGKLVFKLCNATI